MRTVAERVGVTPMALYRHVEDKDALLDALVGRLLAEVRLPEPGRHWREALDAVARVLLTVSGTIPDGLHQEVTDGRRPRVDYLELAVGLDADLIDHERAAAQSRVGRVLRRVGGGSLTLAISCFRQRRRYDVVFTDSERVGMLYALLTAVARRNPTAVSGA